MIKLIYYIFLILSDCFCFFKFNFIMIMFLFKELFFLIFFTNFSKFFLKKLLIFVIFILSVFKSDISLYWL